MEVVRLSALRTGHLYPSGDIPGNKTTGERRLERTVLRPALLPVNTAQFTQFSPQV